MAKREKDEFDARVTRGGLCSTQIKNIKRQSLQ